MKLSQTLHTLRLVLALPPRTPFVGWSIASGGVGTLNHFVDGVKKGKASALLAAAVFHFGKFSISEVKKHLILNDIDVRMDYISR